MPEKDERVEAELKLLVFVSMAPILYFTHGAPGYGFLSPGDSSDMVQVMLPDGRCIGTVTLPAMRHIPGTPETGSYQIGKRTRRMLFECNTAATTHFYQHGLSHEGAPLVIILSGCGPMKAGYWFYQ